MRLDRGRISARAGQPRREQPLRESSQAAATTAQYVHPNADPGRSRAQTRCSAWQGRSRAQAARSGTNLSPYPARRGQAAVRRRWAYPHFGPPVSLRAAVASRRLGPAIPPGSRFFHRNVTSANVVVITIMIVLARARARQPSRPVERRGPVGEARTGARLKNEENVGRCALHVVQCKFGISCSIKSTPPATDSFARTRGPAAARGSGSSVTAVVGSS